MKMTRSVWILAAAALGAAAAGFYLARQLDRAGPQLASGTWYPQARAVAEFELRDAAGQPFTQASLRGQPTLVFFGFTHCPDVCPTTLLKLAQVRRQLAPAPPRVLFISVDPQRDDAHALGEYVHAFDPQFLGATGTPGVIAALASGFGVAVNRVELPGGDYWTSSASRFRDFVMIPPGPGGSLRVSASEGRVGLAMYDVTDAQPDGVTRDGVTFRRAVADSPLLTAAIGGAGQTVVRTSFLGVPGQVRMFRLASIYRETVP